MSMRKASCVATTLAALVCATMPARAEGPNLGQPISEADIKAWDISILPDGTGLPPGSGTPAQGAEIFAQRCAACHGDNAKGGVNAALVGGGPLSAGIDANKTIANFWEYSTTLYDYIRRAMPWPTPRTLSDEETYAITAYILSLNNLIGPGDAMDAQSLPKVRMPNRDGFVVMYPAKH